MTERVEQIELMTEVVAYTAYTGVYSICVCGIRLAVNVLLGTEHYEHACPNCSSTIVTRISGDSYSMFVMKDIPAQPIDLQDRWRDLLEE